MSTATPAAPTAFRFIPATLDATQGGMPSAPAAAQGREKGLPN